MSKPSAPAAFERVVTPRFHEVDRAGIAFFGRVFEYCHVVYEELLGAVMGQGGLDAAFDRLGYGTPVVHAEADYRAPSRFGERLDVGLAVEKLGKSSISFAYSVVGADDGVVRATGRVVCVTMDLATRSAERRPRSSATTASAISMPAVMPADVQR